MIVLLWVSIKSIHLLLVTPILIVLEKLILIVRILLKLPIVWRNIVWLCITLPIILAIILLKALIVLPILIKLNLLVERIRFLLLIRCLNLFLRFLRFICLAQLPIVLEIALQLILLLHHRQILLIGPRPIQFASINEVCPNIAHFQQREGKYCLTFVLELENELILQFAVLWDRYVSDLQFGLVVRFEFVGQLFVGIVE